MTVRDVQVEGVGKGLSFTGHLSDSMPAGNDFRFLFHLPGAVVTLRAVTLPHWIRRCIFKIVFASVVAAAFRCGALKSNVCILMGLAVGPTVLSVVIITIQAKAPVNDCGPQLLFSSSRP